MTKLAIAIPLVISVVCSSHADKHVSYELDNRIILFETNRPGRHCDAKWQTKMAAPYSIVDPFKPATRLIKVAFIDDGEVVSSFDLYVPYRHLTHKASFQQDAAVINPKIHKNGIVDATVEKIPVGPKVAVSDLVPKGNSLILCLEAEQYLSPNYSIEKLSNGIEYPEPMQIRYSFNGEVRVDAGDSTVIELDNDWELVVEAPSR